MIVKAGETVGFDLNPENISALESFQVHKRDDRLVPFDAARIYSAVEKAFKAENSIADEDKLDSTTQERVGNITRAVVEDLLQRAHRGEQLQIELIQDAVENQLMKDGYFSVARRFIVYREERKKARALQTGLTSDEEAEAHVFVKHRDGTREYIDPQRIRRALIEACRGYEDRCSWQDIADEVIRSVYNGITPHEIQQALILASRSRIEKEPAYNFVTARLLLKSVYREVWGRSVPQPEIDSTYRTEFKTYLAKGVAAELLDPKLLDFDMGKTLPGT